MDAPVIRENLIPVEAELLGSPHSCVEGDFDFIQEVWIMLGDDLSEPYFLRIAQESNSATRFLLRLHKPGRIPFRPAVPDGLSVDQ